jgi:pantetheine-phosphate adenylyltransferase
MGAGAQEETQTQEGKMKIAFYPGSFNPWHDGHQDVLNKALMLFDKIVILQMSSFGKDDAGPQKSNPNHPRAEYLYRPEMSIVKAIGNYVIGFADDLERPSFAIIRGMRNEKDFCEEQILTYWYQDLGLKMPIFHIISDRSLVHVSSSAIKAANKFTEKV